METLWIVLAVVLVAVIGLIATTRRPRSTKAAPTKPASQEPKPAPGVDYAPGVNDDATTPVYTPKRTIDDVALPEIPVAPETVIEEVVAEELVVQQPVIEKPEPLAGRFSRLRSRVKGWSLSDLLSRSALDQDAWDEVEETLLLSDVGVSATQELIAQLKKSVKGDNGREVLRSELIALIDGGFDRTLNVRRHPDGKPAVFLVVGVNGTGKTTTTGKLARALVGEGKSVVLGAADTFRAAAAEQLTTWGDRVGATVIRGPEGGDPASVAFDAVKHGAEVMSDVVVVDTAGRLHTKTGLMDELGKVRRVIEKTSTVDEVLLVIDATTGQNGLLQAKVFAEVVSLTGVVLTKLDGSARGGIVISIQRELGVPVKLVGLGEGADDLAPFDPAGFVDALLG